MNSPPAAPHPSPLDGPRAALLLLTRLPAGRGALPRGSLSRAPTFFPLVGLLLGGLGALLLELARPHSGGAVAVLLALGLGVLLTGGLHEDGLADTADAWWGARGPGGSDEDRQRLFAILKDPRHGTYGVLALILSLALRWACLERLGDSAAGALLLTASTSRAWMVPLMAALPYVTPAAVASSGAAARARAGQAVAAVGLALLATVGLCAAGLCDPVASAAAVGGAALVSVWLGWRFRIRAGGITGDFLGAAQQAAEITMLFLLVALA